MPVASLHALRADPAVFRTTCHRVDKIDSELPVAVVPACMRWIASTICAIMVEKIQNMLEGFIDGATYTWGADRSACLPPKQDGLG